MACHVGSQATLKRGCLPSHDSRRLARPLLTRNCSSWTSLASCQVVIAVSKGFQPTRIQLARRANTQQQRRLLAIRCRASSSTPAARNSGLVSTIRQFLVDQFLPVGLLLAMLIGCAAASARYSTCMLCLACLSLSDVWACLQHDRSWLASQMLTQVGTIHC